MRRHKDGLLILLVVLVCLFVGSGCGAPPIKLESSMVGIPNPHKTKVALYFESYQFLGVTHGGIWFDPNLFRERLGRSKDYVQDVFSQVFSGFFRGRFRGSHKVCFKTTSYTSTFVLGSRCHCNEVRQHSIRFPF